MNSMTGFGRGEAGSKTLGLVLRMEISSVNRKQFDLKFSLPRELSPFEAKLRFALSEKVSRGSVTVRVEMEKTDVPGANSPLTSGTRINSDALLSLWRTAADLQLKFGIPGNLTISDLLAVPGVTEPLSGNFDIPEVEALLFDALHNALANYQTMRASEGGRLYADISTRIAALRANTEKIKALTPDLPQKQYERMRERIRIAGFSAEAEDDRILREFIIFTDRLDVSEEITRLFSHFEHFAEIAQNQPSPGRPFDFLVQEIFREINTLGTKAASPEISPLIVEMKTELEKIREQVQNIE